MKKLLCVLLTFALLAFSFAACGKQPGDTPEDAAPVSRKVADDIDVMALHFTAPEGYETVQAFISERVDGKLLEKDITFSFADERELSFGFSPELQLSELLELDDLETREVGGETFYIRESDGAYQAFAQKGADLYALQYDKAESREAFDAVLDGVSFTDAVETKTYDRDLFGATCTIDETLPLFGYTTNIEETPAGDLLKKGVVWQFGTDAQELDYRLMIRVYKNSTVEEAIDDPEKETQEQEIGGIVYTVVKPSSEDEKPYAYYTQQGDDVYLVRNNGASSGWFTSRSEESFAAFETFLNSVRFGTDAGA